MSVSAIMRAILDDSEDDKVFKYNGLELGLDVAPQSIAERLAKKAR